MAESEEVKPRRRRTRQEVQRLVAEYGASGLSRSEFCRFRGMTLGTLQRGLKREREQRADIRTDDRRLVRVKVIGRNAAGDGEGSCGVRVLLTKGRRIELNQDFDANYRGELVFLDQALAQEAKRHLQIEDGWTYFIHGRTQAIAEVFHISIPVSGPVFDHLSDLAIRYGRPSSGSK
jgi:hypothetical protein